MKLESHSFADNRPIPAEFAFCKPDPKTHAGLSRNRSPHLRWSGVPAGAKSFAVICHDGDVPSKADDVNKEGRTIPKDLPRVDFYHWVLLDIPPSTTELPAGADSDGVTAKGKAPGKSAHGFRGINDYTNWFAGDADMGGDYGGYDGPCPPWNDSIVHHYVFTVYALDVASLGLKGKATGAQALKAMEGHVLGSARLTGTYSLNPAVKA
jgi:hypothetical protein